jgi:acyl carrier protein
MGRALARENGGPGLANHHHRKDHRMATTDQEILDRVTTLIAELTDIPKAELLPDKQLAADLEMDSLTTIELAVTIQDEFDIEVADDKLKALKTIQDIVNLIDSSRLTATS